MTIRKGLIRVIMNLESSHLSLQVKRLWVPSRHIIHTFMKLVAVERPRVSMSFADYNGYTNRCSNSIPSRRRSLSSEDFVRLTRERVPLRKHDPR
jgi:hypothetical protein